ncbi:MAG: hypothetical protein NUK65_09160 [Firmicutes bacterium]|nr:hypothetical protein [Bacillota bacterium]
MDKKMLCLVVLVMIIIFATACGGKTETATPQQAPEDNTGEAEAVQLLSGYPEGILPLYKSIRVERCGFSYRDDLNYVIGKDLYNVLFVSEGELDEISDYYQALMTSIEDEDEDYFLKEFFSGAIGENMVNVSVYELDEESCMVALSIGLSEEEYVEENPYFTDHPENLIEEFGLQELQEITYEENYLAKEKVYRTIYQTEKTAQEFTDFYLTKYEAMTNFSEENTDTEIIYRWENTGFQCSVRYTISAQYRFICLEAIMPMP